MTPVHATPSLMTGLEVVEAIERNGDLTDKEKSDFRSAWMRASEWTGIPLPKLIAHPSNLRPRLARLSPGKLGVKKKTITNIRRLLKRSMALVCPKRAARSHKPAYTSEIEALRASIDCKYTWTSLTCLLRYASGLGLRLAEVDDDISNAALDAMLEDGLQKRPLIVHQNACRAWGRLRSRFPELGLKSLAVPKYGKHEALRRDDIPAHLMAEFDVFISRGSTCDPFDLSSPIKPWSMATISTYKSLFHRYMGWLVSAGVDLGTLGSLTDVARADQCVAVFDKRGLRQNTKGRASAANITYLLSLICEFKANNEQNGKCKQLLFEQSASLKALATRLRKLRQKSSKNRDRLANLRDESNLARLFLLPFTLERELSKISKPKEADALLMQWAVALCILTFCPLRISSLCSIRLDRHLRWTRPDMKGSLWLEFAEGELKNGEPASLPLPAECARMIRVYLRRFRTLLAAAENPHLFSGASSERPKGAGVMSGQLSRLIEDRTGLPVNPHLYRRAPSLSGRLRDDCACTDSSIHRHDHQELFIFRRRTRGGCVPEAGARCPEWGCRDRQ